MATTAFSNSFGDASQNLVPVEVYLNSNYSPDREYVDGEVLERNVGEIPHSSLQKFLISYFVKNEKAWNVRVWPEARVQVGKTRYRVPDICVMDRYAPYEPILRTPPLICIEILSPEDRMSRTQESVDDYIAMGVRVVWVIDPRRRSAQFAERSATLQPAAEVLTLEGTEIRVALSDMFAELDELMCGV